MRWKETVVGIGIVLFAGAGCAGTDASNPQPVVDQGQQNAPIAAPSSAAPPVDTGGAPAPGTPGQPGRQPVQGPPPNATAVPAAQLDGSALPGSFPKQAYLSDNGSTLSVRAEEGGCDHATVTADESKPGTVTVVLAETKSQTSKMCTMDIRHPVVSVTLKAPLADRKVVLTQARPK